MSKYILRGGVERVGTGEDLFAPIAKEKLPPRTQARGVSPRDLVLEHAQELKQEAMEKGYLEGLEKGRTEGYQMGLAEGKRDGERSLREEHEAAIQEALRLFANDLDQVIAQVNGAVSRWYDEAEQRLASIAAENVARLLRTELLTQPETVQSMVRETLKELGESRSVRVRLAPFDYPYLVNLKDAILAECSHLTHLEFVEDDSLAGGCVIEGEHGVLDRSVDVYSELIREAA